MAISTAPNRQVARRLARAFLDRHLVACVNLIPAVESHYWWEGKIDVSKEVVLVMKTTAAKIRALEQLLLELHPYDTPEFLVGTISGGNRRYLEWLVGMVGGRRNAER